MPVLVPEGFLQDIPAGWGRPGRGANRPDARRRRTARIDPDAVPQPRGDHLRRRSLRLIFQGLSHLKAEITRAIGDRLVVIKPNNRGYRLSALRHDGREPRGAARILEIDREAQERRHRRIRRHGTDTRRASPTTGRAAGREIWREARGPGPGGDSIVHVLDQNDMRPHARARLPGCCWIGTTPSSSRPPSSRPTTWWWPRSP